MAAKGGRKLKDGKLTGGPKLHIAPHQSPPGTPPPFLSLLDSFSQLKASLRSTLPNFTDNEGRVSELLLPSSTTKVHKINKEAVKRKAAAGRVHTSPDDLASAKAALRKLEADGVIFSHPINFADNEEGEPDARSHSVPPGGKASKKTRAKKSVDKGDLRQQHAMLDEEEPQEASTKPPLRAAVTEEEKAQQRMKIEGSLKLAESILLGSKTYNRIENARYHGSNPLTFPSVQKYGGEAFELDENAGKAYDKKKWDEHAKARAAGVTAMEQLLQRHHKLKEEKEALAEELADFKAQVQREKAVVDETRERTTELEQERARLQRIIAKADAAREKEKQDHTREISRLQDLLRGLRDKCENLADQKNELESNQQDFEGNSKKLKDSIETLRKELNEKSTREREDAVKIAKLVEENARLTLANEGLEHELELLDEDFAYAKLKLKSAQQFAERVTKEHHEKMKVLNEKLSTRLAVAEQSLEEETGLHHELEGKLAEAQSSLAFYSERAAQLDAELKKTKVLSHESNSKLSAALSELQVSKTKNKWSWLICLSLVFYAFPHNDDNFCQTDGSITAEQSTMTEFLSASGEFTRYWGEVVRAAHRMDLKGADAAGRMTLTELLGFISTTYTRKLISDTVDEQTHFPKQSLQEFMLTFFLEVSGDKESAFQSVATLLANLEYFLSMGPSAKMGGPKDKRPALTSAQSTESESMNLVAVMPRLQMFARFLGVDADGIEAFPQDALSVFLATLLRIRKGQYPLLPPTAEKVSVSSAEFVDSVDYVLAQLKSHERMSLKNHFYKDVSLGRAQVDLDNALRWVTVRWMDMVHDKTDERLRSLFVSADSDGDGNLDFDEYFGMLRKLRADQRELPPLPQLIRMYGKMMLGVRVDASIFVRIAREEELCPFTAGPLADNIGVDKTAFVSLIDEWKRIEPATVQMMRRLEGKPEGMRLACDVAVLRALLGRRVQADHTRHFLTCLTKVFNVPQALVPRPRQQGLSFISPAMADRKSVV